ncbi:MAG: AhpC/TSA family protein [Bacteroidales bacterium]|jgi:peroxiredoxin|nr:AhpC/TSA family protein [Bacteroidales bacterium]
MKKFSILGFLVFLLIGCGQEKPIHIKGKLNESQKETIYLHKLGVDKQSTVTDSTRLDENGNFSFKQKISQPTFYSLTVNNKTISLLAHPKDKIFITGDTRLLDLTYNVEGSDDSKDIKRLSERIERTAFFADSLEKTLKLFENNRNYVNIQRQFQWHYMKEIDSLRAYNIRFIKNNPNSLVVIYALYQQITPNLYVFNDEDDIQYFRKADSVFYKQYPKIPHVKMLHANVLEMNEQYRIKKLNKMMSMLGQDAPEIALPSPNGQIKKLSSFRGKYVLVDFWASWSAPCRTENINLLRIYNKYHDKGFEIFQVSLDRSKASWEKAIKEDGLIWTHVSDLKFWDSEPVKAYGVETIPANFLIDTEGSIITKELRGDVLDRYLGEIFSTTE